jgi:alpha-beta hydrolase superfamily lysophospholipase
MLASPLIEKRIIIFIKIIIYVYILGFLGFFLFQRFIFLHPKSYPIEKKYPFEAREFNVITADNVLLNSLMFSTKDSIKKGVVMYLHGNSDNLERWGKYASEFTKRGYDVIMYDYRGFGKTKGRLDENNLLRDAQAMYDDISRRFSEKRLIVYGRSLGTAPATRLAMNNHPKMLILETPYYSIPELATEHLPIYPYRWVSEFQLPTYQWIVNVKCPIHIFHGTSDNISPYRQSLKLAEVLKKKPEEILTTLPDGEHRDLEKFKAYQTKMDELLKN